MRQPSVLKKPGLMLGALMLAGLAQAAAAKDYYVAPIGATLCATPDGSQACPFASIDKAFSSKKIAGGDTVYLLDGEFGGVEKLGASFPSPVVIRSLNGKKARISYITFEATAKNITLSHLKVWRDGSDKTNGFLIRSYEGSTNLTFEYLDIRSRANAKDYMTWTLDRWLKVGGTGLSLSGTFSTVRNCTLTGVAGGIYAGTNSLVEDNVVDGFFEDGMKGGSRSIFRRNLVKNIVNANPEYHSDGFQSYSPETVTGLTLEGNTIIQWTGDPASPMKGSLQGIGLYDGWYDDLLIQNNLVITDHYHGISVYGTRGAQILNNTVVDLSGLPNTSPWIKVTERKDGSPSQDVLVANNLAMSVSVTPDAARNVVVANNSVILDPAAVFTSLKDFNYLPTKSSGYLDTGNVMDAPDTDILGAARPYGKGPDRGAYEVQGSTTATTALVASTTTAETTTTVSNGAKFVSVPQN